MTALSKEQRKRLQAQISRFLKNVTYKHSVFWVDAKQKNLSWKNVWNVTNNRDFTKAFEAFIVKRIQEFR